MEDQCCFGIVPDDREQPSAVFFDLEEAIAWGLAKYGGDRFRIRRCDLAVVSPGQTQRGD
jgi:hypothetical protein